MNENKRFAFGRNWSAFVDRKFSEEREPDGGEGSGAAPAILRRKQPGDGLLDRHRDWLGGWPMEFVHEDALLRDPCDDAGLSLLRMDTGNGNTELLFRAPGAPPQEGSAPGLRRPPRPADAHPPVRPLHPCGGPHVAGGSAAPA